MLNTVFSFVPWPSGKLVDSVFPVIDAICRSGAIVGAVSAVRAHPNPLVANSLLAQVIIGGVASVGGGAAAGFFGVWDKEWSLKTPAFLKGYVCCIVTIYKTALTCSICSGIIATMDLWAGSIAAIIYGIATLSNPAYEQAATYLVGSPKAMMTPLGGRALVVIFLSVMYFIRVFSIHYAPRMTSKPVANGTTQKRAIKPVPKEKKVQ